MRSSLPLSFVVCLGIVGACSSGDDSSTTVDGGQSGGASGVIVRF